jgi:hypothetical protein
MDFMHYKGRLNDLMCSNAVINQIKPNNIKRVYSKLSSQLQQYKQYADDFCDFYF